jgi:hypothetical protein
MKIKTVMMALGCAASLLAGQASAGTYNVQAIQGNYSSVRPPVLGQYSTAQGLKYATIQAAVNAASSNSIINVGPGFYRENLSFGTKQMITVRSTSGAAATIIDGSSLAPLITVGQNAAQMAGMPVTLTGFTLQNGYSATNGGVASVGAKSELTFADCIIMNNRAGSGGAFAVAGTGGVLTIRNSLIAKNTSINAGGAIFADLGGKAILVNDTISANIAAVGASLNQLYGATVTGLNNIIFGNVNVDGTPGLPIFNGPLTATLTYSDIEGGLAGTGNINAAPQFVNAAGNNFQLSAGSPAIDAAIANTVPATATPAKDLLGVSRPQGAALDMGAYEYAAPVLPPVNGVCGGANGGIFVAVPTTGLCATGTASAVTGSGPFTWTCAGSNGGTAASCAAQYQAPADVTPPAAVSIVATGTSGSTATVTVTFSENVLMTKPLGTIVKIGNLNTVVTGLQGSTVFTIKLMSCCIPNLVPGTEYILTIPAGSFRDSAGNLNELITAPVTFGAAPVPVNGVCGSANGAIFSVVPTAGLCATGTASVVSGSGPFAWTCAGSNGGVAASCSALLQVADITPPAVVSAVVKKGSTVAADVITVTFTEAVTKAKPLDAIMKIGTADTTSSVSGSTVTIKVKSCCLNKVRSGKTYTLAIPAGSFKDAAGNLNAAYSVAVTL